MSPSVLKVAEQLSAAALYAVFAAILLAVAHRLILRISWRARLTLALLPLCFTGSALLTGRVYAPIDLAYSADPLEPYAEQYGIGSERKGIFTDIYSAIMPWRQAVSYAVRHGEWPLWNPFILCGDPLAGSAQPAPYYPINALSLLLPIALAFTFGATAQFLASALAAFLYFRDLECREVAAVLGAVGWAFCSFLAFWLEWPLGATVALAPLAALGARRMVRQPGWNSALLLAAAVVLTVFAGHPESGAHVVAVGGVLGLAEVVAMPRRQWGQWRRWLTVAGWTAAAAALSVALSAVFLLPLLESLQQTMQWLFRKNLMTMPHVASAMDAWDHVAASLVPSIVAEPGEGAHAAKASFLMGPLASAYAGTVLWGPAIYGLVRGRWRGRWVLAAFGVIGLCAGARMPGIYPFLGHLPLLSMSLNDRLVFAGALAAATLAALGVEAWLRAVDEGAAARASRELAGVCAVVALAYGAALAWMVPLGHAAGYPDSALWSWAAWSLAPLVAVALITGFAAWPRLSRRTVAWAAAAIVVALAVQRTGEMGSFYPTLPADAYYPKVPPLASLPVDDEIPWRFVGQDFQMIPNQSAHYEIEDVRGYQAVFNRRFAELFPLWAHPLPSWYLSVRNLNRPFFSLVNVRFAMTRVERNPPGWESRGGSSTSEIWENPNVLPRAFVPWRVRFGVPEDQEVVQMNAESDFGRRAWIVPPGGYHGPPREERNGRGRIVTFRRGLGFELKAKMRRAAWVVISETAWTGWRARLDGREVPLGIADHAFLTLAIPEGRHRVELFYRPRSFEIGLALSIGAVVLILIVSLVRWLRRRRATATAATATAAEATTDRRTGDRVAIPGDYQYRALHSGPAPQRFWHRAKLESALDLLRLEPGDRMLDAGCGSGLLAAMAAESPGVEVLGVDANPAALEFAAHTWNLPNLSFRRGLVDELDAAPGSFEKIAFLEVIEHLSRAQGEVVLAEFARLLAPGGRLVLTTPNRRSPWPLVEWLLDRFRLVPPLAGEQHEVLYDLDELRAMGEAAGLVYREHMMIDTVAPWLAGWPALARAVHRLEVRVIRRHGCVMVLAFEKRR